jgi:hypothetical protein
MAGSISHATVRGKPYAEMGILLRIGLFQDNFTNVVVQDCDGQPSPVVVICPSPRSMEARVMSADPGSTRLILSTRITWEALQIRKCVRIALTGELGHDEKLPGLVRLFTSPQLLNCLIAG